MRKIVLWSLCLLFLVMSQSCKKESDGKGNALLIGADLRKCAIPNCGGWWIEINSETYRFYDIPFSTNIPFNVDDNFPIEVDVNWKAGDRKWPDNQELIEVISIFKAE